jgi:hypothetical protein
MTPLEWILTIALILSGGGNVKQKMDLKKKGKEIEQHVVKEQKNAEELQKNYKLIEELYKQIEAKTKEIKNVQDAADEKTGRLEKQFSTDISVAFEQAKDIQNEHDSPYTRKHLETLKEYVKTHGYDGLAQVIKWNLEVIKQQQLKIREVKKERDDLLYERNSLRLERDDLNIKYANKSGQHHALLVENGKLSNDGRRLSAELQEKIAKVTGLSGIIAEYTWMIKLGAIIFIFIFGGNIWQWFLGKKHKLFGKKVQEELVKRNNTFKKFIKRDDEGNATMMKILEEEEIDLEEDGNGGTKKAAQKKKEQEEKEQYQEFLKWQRDQLINK